jgi:hypothetical protein
MQPIENADAYRNLLRKCVSVRHGGKVIGRAQNMVMTDVEFRVRPAGVKRIRARGEREVIAYARGTIVELHDNTPPAIPAGAQKVCFNPFKHDTFVLENGAPVAYADVLIMHSPCGSWVINPR